jgi:hypothetical protein
MEQSMDNQLYISILGDHSDHIGKVAAELSAQLQQLAQALREPQSAAPMDTAACLAGVERLQGRLVAETDIFCQRLSIFVERASRQLADGAPRPPKDGRTTTPQDSDSLPETIPAAEPPTKNESE